MTTSVGQPEAAEPSRIAEPTRVLRVASVLVRLAFAALLLVPVCGFVAGAAEADLAARLAVAGLVCVTLARPDEALLLCGGFIVIAGPLAIVLGWTHSLREPLLLAFLGAWVIRETVKPGPAADADTRAIVRPALVLAALVGAAMLVQLMVDQALADYPWPFVRNLFVSFATDYLSGNPHPEFSVGAALLEGIGLFVAAVVLFRRQRGLAARTLGMAAVSAAAVGIFNVYRLVEASFQGDLPPHEKLRWVLRMRRINWVFPDVNAAGSYLSMMALATVGLIAKARRRVGWAIVGLLILAGWFLAGSRAPLVTAPFAVVAILLWLVAAKRAWSWRLVAIIALGGLAGAAVLWWLVAYQEADRTMALTLQWRLRLWRMAIDVASAHPLFGVGPARLWAVSGGYMDAATRATFPHENAHNNFLQILAEFGVTGLVAFLWLLYAVARRVRAALVDAWDWRLIFAAAAMLTFLVTCLAGHPLLIREVSDGFWIVLAVIAGLALETNREAEGGRRGVGARVLWAAALVCLAVSIPIRANQVIRDEADLTRATVGFSGWQQDDQGVWYRTMAGRARFYIRGRTCELRVGLRLDAAAPTTNAEVEVRVDDRTANRIVAVSGEWREVRMLLRGDEAARFRQVELRASSDVRLRVTRATTDCR